MSLAWPACGASATATVATHAAWRTYLPAPDILDETAISLLRTQHLHHDTRDRFTRRRTGTSLQNGESFAKNADYAKRRFVPRVKTDFAITVSKA